MAETGIKHEGEKSGKNFSRFYNKYYKLSLILPLILLILSLSYLVYFYSQNNDILKRDVSLTGGTTITIYNSEINIDEMNSALSSSLQNFYIRSISDFRTGKQEAVLVQTTSEIEETTKVVEEFLGFKLNEDNSSIEFTGSSLSDSFYKQLRWAIIIAFILMALVVFLIFRTFVPSFAVILSGFADIVMTLTLVDFLGWKISSAGIVAFLMLIGYSVDTDIMLTSRLLKRKEEAINSRIYSAFKTGMTMTLTSIAAVIVALIITSNFSDILKQIFSILTIGLSFDILNTWVSNASILKWYVEKKERGRN